MELSNKIRKLLRVAIIGSPNAGKSTLLNRLVMSDISCVSNKVHTTRKNVLGVYTQDDTQLEFMDSPGLITKDHAKKHNLDHNMLTDPLGATEKCDLITVVVDASNIREQLTLNKGVISILGKFYDRHRFLVLNKVDLLKDKRKLLDMSKNFNQKNVIVRQFDEVFSISALKDDCVDQVRLAMLTRAKLVDRWPHSGDYLTNQDTRDIVNNIIRGQLMDIVDKEVPYLVDFKYPYCNFDEFGNLHVQCMIKCQERYMVSKVIGKHGVQVHSLIDASRELISKTLGCDVKLTINVYSN